MKYVKRNTLIIKYIAAIGIILLILFLLEKFLSGFWLTLLMLFGINIILAISLNITNGWIGFFSVGHGGIMLAGAYAAAFFTLPVSFKEGILNLHLPSFMLHTQLSFLPALLLGGIVGTVIGIILVLPALRLRGFYFCAGTLGFNIIMETISENIPDITNGAMGLSQFPSYTNIWWVWGIAILLIYITWVVKKSYIGRAFITIGKDPDLAEHTGINLLKYKVYAFGFSAFFTALGGILWVHLILNLFPKAFDLVLVFEVVAMIVIGGMGSITGSIIGAAIITFFADILAPIEEGFSLFGFNIPRMLGLMTVLIGVLLVVILIKKPDGIMGEKEISQGFFRKFLRTKQS
jgi:branched-chain amino acid transport system permease protein